MAMGGTPLVLIPGQTHERAANDVGDLLVAITEAETRAIRLVREGTRMPVEVLVKEFSDLGQEIRGHFRRLVDLAERRDLGFGTQRKLRQLQEQCLWLYRKARREAVFFTKLSLEARLRELISPDAFKVYQRLLCADDEERRLAARDDTALATLLLSEGEEAGLS